MLPTFPLLPVTNNPHYRCGVFPPGKLCLFDSIHMTDGSKACRLHDAFRFASYCKPATEMGHQQRNMVVMSHPVLWLSAKVMSECIHRQWKKITGAFGCSDVDAPLHYSTVLEGQSWYPFLMVVATYINAHLHEVRLCLLFNFFKCTFITLNFVFYCLDIWKWWPI